MKSFCVAVFAVLALFTPSALGKPAAVLQKVQDSSVATDKFIQDSTNPCVYKGRYLKINLQKIADQFRRMNITVTKPNNNGDYIYFVSLCSPITCEFGPSKDLVGPNDDVTGSAACQYITNQKRFVKLGATADSHFEFTSLTHFSLLFTHGSVDDTLLRQTRVDFVSSTDCGRKASIEFSGEETRNGVSTYMFTVKMRLDEPELFTFM